MQGSESQPDDQGKLDRWVGDMLFSNGIPIAAKSYDMLPTKTPGQVIQNHVRHLIGECPALCDAIAKEVIEAAKVAADRQ
jgi:hypothetical protein